MNIKRIGILTFHDTLNYGALLQTYALNRYLNDTIGNCQTIDYKCDEIERNESPLAFFKGFDVKRIVKGLLSLNYTLKKKKKFNDFTKGHIKMTEKRYNKNTIGRVASLFDIFIVGSDQVWNSKLTNGDYSYFLDFVDSTKTKVAYAASFGEKWYENERLLQEKNLLKQFDRISVRENTGRILCEQLIDRKCNTVLDPVFLLNVQQWEKVEEMYRFNKKYVLVYFIHYDFSNTMKLAIQIAKEHDLDLIYINNTYKNYPGVRNVKSASPGQFLYLIKNAEYVVTGSFHGLSFSILYNKKFIYECERTKTETRLSNLASMLNVSNRCIGNCKIDDEIDYEKVNSVLETFKIESRAFLKMLGDKK